MKNINSGTLYNFSVDWTNYWSEERNYEKINDIKLEIETIV